MNSCMYGLEPTSPITQPTLSMSVTTELVIVTFSCMRRTFFFPGKAIDAIHDTRKTVIVEHHRVKGCKKSMYARHEEQTKPSSRSEKKGRKLPSLTIARRHDADKRLIRDMTNPWTANIASKQSDWLEVQGHPRVSRKRGGNF